MLTSPDRPSPSGTIDSDPLRARNLLDDPRLRALLGITDDDDGMEPESAPAGR